MPFALQQLAQVHLSRAAEGRNRHPWRWPVLASVDAQGHPQARVVVVRALDWQRRELVIYTDARSPKVAQLRAQPRASLVFHHPGERLQLRLEGVVAVEVGSGANAALWNDLSAGQTRDYRNTEAPGSPLNNGTEAGTPLLLDPDDDRHFTRLRITMNALDLLQLGRGGTHARARLTWDAATHTWQTQGLVP